ncbi:hypothetical protein SAMN06272721_10413 [Arthrobacter sp. P2b]|nr:hypothetical protein SAMN06272721_10413 [Arthrobacter sp. P2b]
MARWGSSAIRPSSSSLSSLRSSSDIGMACPCISRDADIGIDRRSLIPPSQDLPAPGLTPLSTQPFSSDQLVFMDGTAKAG